MASKRSAPWYRSCLIPSCITWPEIAANHAIECDTDGIPIELRVFTIPYLAELLQVVRIQKLKSHPHFHQTLRELPSTVVATILANSLLVLVGDSVNGCASPLSDLGSSLDSRIDAQDLPPIASSPSGHQLFARCWHACWTKLSVSRSYCDVRTSPCLEMCRPAGHMHDEVGCE